MLNFIVKKESSPVIGCLSRDKYYGYMFSMVSIQYENTKKRYHKGMEADTMLRLYFKNICPKPSCYQCHYKTIHKISDFTIFDCWDAQSISKTFSNKEATNVFIHTIKGKKIFEQIKHQFVYQTEDIQKIIQRDGIMTKNLIPINHLRNEFFQDLNQLPFEELTNKY